MKISRAKRQINYVGDSRDQECLVMPCGWENTAYNRLVHWLAVNVVLAEHNWCGHVAWGRARLVLPHTGHTVTVLESNSAAMKHESINQKRIKVTKVTNVTARPLWGAATLNNLTCHSFLYTLHYTIATLYFGEIGVCSMCCQKLVIAQKYSAGLRYSFGPISQNFGFGRILYEHVWFTSSVQTLEVTFNN